MLPYSVTDNQPENTQKGIDRRIIKGRLNIQEIGGGEIFMEMEYSEDNSSRGGNMF